MPAIFLHMHNFIFFYWMFLSNRRNRLIYLASAQSLAPTQPFLKTSFNANAQMTMVYCKPISGQREAPGEAVCRVLYAAPQVGFKVCSGYTLINGVNFCLRALSLRRGRVGRNRSRVKICLRRNPGAPYSVLSRPLRLGSSVGRAED